MTAGTVAGQGAATTSSMEPESGLALKDPQPAPESQGTPETPAVNGTAGPSADASRPRSADTDAIAAAAEITQALPVVLAPRAVVPVQAPAGHAHADADTAPIPRQPRNEPHPVKRPPRKASRLVRRPRRPAAPAASAASAGSAASAASVAPAEPAKLARPANQEQLSKIVDARPLGAQRSSEDRPATAPDEPAGSHSVPHDVETQHVSVQAIRQYAAQRALDDLCVEFGPICRSAVDPLEIASALEFDGISDSAAESRYGCPDVFSLADEMYRRVKREPAEPEPAPDPWHQFSRLRPALRGVLYGLPGVMFPAGSGLLIGPAVPSVLIVALLTAWSLSQALAYLGYRRLGTPEAGRAPQLMLASLAGAITLVAAALAATGQAAHPHLSVLAFGFGEAIYMLSASIAMIMGREQLLLVSLAPGVLASAAFLLAGRPVAEQHVLWAAMAATPVLALGIAAALTARAWIAERSRRSAGSGRPLFILTEFPGAMAAAAFGLVSGGLLVFPVAAGPDGHGGVNFGALLASLPITLSMGVAEWGLLWYRRRMRSLLVATTERRQFAGRGRLALAVAMALYILAAIVLMSVVALAADQSGLLKFRQPMLLPLAAYLALGTAMFLAMLLQAVGDRIIPLVICAVALAVELSCRQFGAINQIAVPAALCVAMIGYATWAQNSPVRYAC